MKTALLYLAFVAAAAGTVFAFTAGATWAGILSGLAGVLVVGGIITSRGEE